MCSLSVKISDEIPPSVPQKRAILTNRKGFQEELSHAKIALTQTQDALAERVGKLHAATAIRKKAKEECDMSKEEYEKAEKRRLALDIELVKTRDLSQVERERVLGMYNQAEDLCDEADDNYKSAKVNYVKAIKNEKELEIQEKTIYESYKKAKVCYDNIVNKIKQPEHMPTHSSKLLPLPESFPYTGISPSIKKVLISPSSIKTGFDSSVKLLGSHIR